jgi:hypothetical protein
VLLGWADVADEDAWDESRRTRPAHQAQGLEAMLSTRDIRLIQVMPTLHIRVDFFLTFARSFLNTSSKQFGRRIEAATDNESANVCYAT